MNLRVDWFVVTLSIPYDKSDFVLYKRYASWY